MNALYRRIVRLVCASVLMFAAVSPAAAAGRELALQQARAALVDAKLPTGLSQALGAKLVKAARLAAAGSPKALDAAAQQIAEAEGLLDETSARKIPADVRETLRRRFEALSESLRRAPVVMSTPVTVRAWTVDELGANVAAGAAVSVRVDGAEVAQTAADGTASIGVAEGDHVFTAAAAVDVGASMTATIAGGSTPPPIDIVMGTGGDFSFPCALQIDDATDNVVAANLSSFTLRLRDGGGAAIALQQLTSAAFESPKGLSNMTAAFAVGSAGEVSATDAVALRTALLDSFGPFTISIRGTDAQGRPYRGSARFDIGRYHLTGVLSGPPSVSVAALPVRVTNQRNGFSFWTTTTAAGGIAFPAALPEGVYIARCETVSGGVRYIAHTAFVLDSDKNFTASLQSLTAN
jgi:hypothetical protein